MAITSRYGLALLASGQAQKELTVNEGLNLLDTVIHGCCSGSPTNAPPSEPLDGMAYLCGANPTGLWSGHPSDIACWTPGGWRFIRPAEGMQFTDVEDGCTRTYLHGQWSVGVVEAKELRINGEKVVGDRRAAIAMPSGGSTIDLEARAALNEVLSALRSHGLIAY